MDFNHLAWGALCFYYRSGGDSKYGRIMKDSSFLYRLRECPEDISVTEFEEKVVLDHVRIENYDLLVGHNLAGNILSQIISLQPDIAELKDYSLIDCNLADRSVTERINRVYAGLYSVRGLWITGVSKISHLLNDRLFVLLNLNISSQFKLIDGDTSLIQWLKITQKNMKEVTEDFHRRGYKGQPEEFLSEKLGYTEQGYQKSLVKFIDEYFWLRFGDNLPIPPRWSPEKVGKD